MTRILCFPYYSFLPQATPKSFVGEGESADDEEQDEPSEHRCLWKNCGDTFDCQGVLVQHVNTEHIQKNKKDCSCYWEDCNREEKPFKAMYMLVVHVRRHTGEKPHKCSVRIIYCSVLNS